MVFRIFLVLILFISNIDLLLSTTIEIKGKQLFVNGDPFVIRGVCYGPVPVGKTISTYNWWEDPSMYSIDFPMIKAMGANCIRTYSVVTLKAALDAAYQNGLYVIMEYPIPWNTAYSNNTTIRTQVFNQVYDMVSKWKDHPAILMWCLGHEVNYNINVVAGDLQTDATCTNRLDDWYPFLNEVAGKVHEWETPYWHPVTTGSGCFDSTNMGIWRDAWHYGMDNLGNPIFNAEDAKMPNLDCWGLQTYNGPGFSPGYFTKYAAQSSKPMWIAETGCDTWNSMANVENQDIQATYMQAQWQAIDQNLSAKDPSKSCLGVTFFSWDDGWWKSSTGNNNTQDTNGDYHNFYYYDQVPGYSNMDEEWWGVVSIFPGTYEKTPKKGFYLLQSLWAAPDPNANTLDNRLFRKVSVNVPNPFIMGKDQYTDIYAYLKFSSSVKARIYDYSGKLIKELNEPKEFAGYVYQMRWDGTDEDNNRVKSGLYLCKITAKYDIKSSSQQEYQIIKIAVLK